MRLLGWVALAGCGATVGVPLHAQHPPASLATFLQQRIGLDSARIASIEHGDAIVKVLDTENKRDVAVATVPAHDVDDVKKCKPGDCKIKLPAAEMQRLQSEIDWSAADPGTQLNAYVRRRLVEYVTDYRKRGDSALVVYDDVGGVHASDAFAALLAQSPYVYQDFPSLRQYLTAYPHAELDGAHEALFWADDSPSGLQPILSVTHQVVFAPSELPGVTLMASKQIYANHYFEAVFDLTGIVDRTREGGKPGIYLVVLRRFRFDDLPSGGIFNIRGKVVGKLRDQLRADLEHQKAASEKALGS